MQVKNKGRGRQRLVLWGLMAAMLGLWGKALSLQVLDQKFLRQQANRQVLDIVEIPAHRGRIRDRNHEQLAVSAPVKSVWVNPREFAANPQQEARIAQLLGLPVERLQALSNPEDRRRFVYLKRRVEPSLADAVKALDVPGLDVQREYRRFYPDGEVSGHLIGFTDFEDRGQVGLELAYDEWLRGKPGSKRIMRDGRRRILEDVEQIRAPQPGQDLVLSIDQRLQYLAYRVLKAAVIKHQAAAASLVMLDPHSGEVLAMVNQPAFNPNSTRQRLEPNYRNRALVDTFEPGSTMKPFALSAALDAGVVRPETTVSTGPGYFRVGRRMVRDHHNYGTLDVAGILQKSSNVGTAKIVLGMPSADLWGMYRRLGFGKVPGTGFPGEQAGVLRHYSQWRDIEKATLSFGYGVSTTTLHLARAYAAIANDGAMPIVSLIKRESTPPAIRVMSAQTARNVRKMLEQVVSREGTAVQAGVSGYGVAGKTGTVRKIKNGHYSTDDYQSLFVGMAPASRPRLVIAVVVDSPHGGQYYGGAVAAPLFSAVMAESLKVLGIPPDQMESPPMRVAGKDGATHVR